MEQLESVASFRTWRTSVEGRVGFVPTMGALHEGHLALVRESLAVTDVTVVSIYVNPTQFNNASDLSNYPDTLAADLAALKELGVDAVFMPTYDEIYPDNFVYEIDETDFSRELCGAHRPGHFKGVLTVVMKLLNIVQPQKAFFGEKDYQQLTLIRGMAEAFFLPVEVIGVATVRETDGLAMSSRNLNLDDCSRARAPRLHALIASTAEDADVIDTLTAEGFDVDYVVTRGDRRYAAATLGPVDRPVRLIDNVRRAS